ncbi:MAG: polyphosphate:AMP phosphotransferase, partial [Pollutimonas bauzanensis]
PMFDTAESDPRLTKEQARPLEAKLRAALLKAQYARLKKAQRSLLIVVAGIDGAGKGASVSLLNEWMDARHIRTMAFGAPTAEEKDHPFLWRYWRQLPAGGKIGIVFGSWYQPLFQEAARKRPDQAAIQAHAQDIRHFENLLSNDGVQIIKLWYHLSQDAQRARIDQLLSDPRTAWQVRPEEIKARKKFSRLRDAGALGISLTHSDHAPWQVIPSADEQMRSIATGQAVLAALRRAAHKPVADLPDSGAMEASGQALRAAEIKAALRGAAQRKAVRLEDLDYRATLSDKEYEEQLAMWQGRLAELARSKKFSRLPLILVFEGNDAAGKGGAIRRIT